MSKSVIRVKGKRPKKAKAGWWQLPKAKRDELRAKDRLHRKKVKAADLERRDASAKHKMALKRRAELAKAKESQP